MVEIDHIGHLPPQDKIISFDEAAVLFRQARSAGIRTKVALGVLDIPHVGHTRYLHAADQATPGILALGLENDASVALNKPDRPINNEDERAEFASELEVVKLVFILPGAPSYDDSSAFTERYKAFGPAQVAVPVFDPHLELKIKQARAAGSGIIPVNYEFHHNSTTRMLNKLGYQS